MKHIFITACLAVSIISSAFATDNSSLISTNCCTAEWSTFTIESNTVVAKFTPELRENNERAFYNNDGSFAGTTKRIAFDKLPERAIRNIGKNYPVPDFTVKECIEFTNAFGETNYYVSFDSEKAKTIVEVSPFGSVVLFKKTQK